MTGTLYVVPTPIGDLDDLSPRAKRVLGSVSLVAAEDTRVTRRLYEALGLPCPTLISNHDHNERERAAGLLRALERGEDVAVVSDAGTPLISDPGYRAVVAAVEAGVRVVSLPGPSAVVTALAGSGLPTDRFVFVGFPPRGDEKRAELLASRAFEPATLVAFEAPHRVVETLRAMAGAWGDRRAVVARSLTKPAFEAFHRGRLLELADAFEAEGRVLGELTLLVEGFVGDPSDAHRDLAENLLRALVQAGVSPSTLRDAVAPVLGLPKRQVYQRALALREDRP